VLADSKGDVPQAEGCSLKDEVKEQSTDVHKPLNVQRALLMRNEELQCCAHIQQIISYI
jgi:hypothetical protein